MKRKKQKMKNLKRTGFTLIELLVVIVIIGILSTISVSTFQGYFIKARNAKIIHSVALYKKGLELYLAQNEEYPVLGTSTGRAYHCMGEYPASDIELEGQCWGTTPSNGYFKNDIINQEVENAIGSLPKIDWYVQKTPSGKRRGALFGRDPADYLASGEQAYYSLVYFLEGTDQDCGLRVHKFVSSVLVEAEKNTNPDSSGTTQCWHVLYQPEGEA